MVGTLALTLAAFAIGFLVYATTTRDVQVFDRLSSYSDIYAFVLAAATAVLALLAFAVRDSRQSPSAQPGADEPGDTGAELDRAAAHLSTAVAVQWRRELTARGLSRPQPLAVSWSSTGRPVSAAPAAILSPADIGGRPTRVKFRGDLSDLARKFRVLPYRQLVVLGEPGAGKSVLAMRLLLDLVGHPVDGEPVPVLLSLSTWDPTESLDGWMARRLREEYPDLTGQGPSGGDASTALVAAGRVMPILDGLDEMSAELRLRAIEQIDAACEGRQLVLTCRGAEYESMVESSGRFLSSAAVVEIEPVPPNQVIAYLRARIRDGDERWESVFASMRDEPRSPLAAALSTPLMIYLSLVSYGPRDSAPTELCGLTSRAEIEERLLTAFLPAVYSARRLDGETTKFRVYPVDRAIGWLTFLATRLRQDGDYDLAWWRFTTMDRRLGDPRRVGPAVVALVTLVVTISTAVAGRTTVSAALGLSTCLVAGATGAGLVAGSAVPKYANLAVHGRLRQLASAVRAHFASWFAAGFVGGAGAGLATALLVEVLTGVQPSIAGWLLDGLLYALLAGTAVGLLVGLCGGLVGWLQAPADEVRARDPVSVLRADRTIAAVNSGVAGAICALGIGLPMTIYAGLAAGAVWGGAGAATAILATALGTAWGRFCIVRLWLASCGVLPLRLMRFLDDAHRRGVLRQAGGVYQFRHVELRDQLAEHTADTIVAPPQRKYPLALRWPFAGGRRTGSADSQPLGHGGHGGSARLALLTAAVVATSVTTFLTLYMAVPGNRDHFQRTFSACMETTGLAAGLWQGGDDELDRALVRLTRCVAPFYADQARWVGWGLLSMIAVAALLYWLHPWWIIYRRRYRALEERDGQNLIATVERLSRQAGLARPPRILVSPTPWSGQMVFGRVGRRYLVLGMRPVIIGPTDRATFEAVTLRSLAHLRNGDVDQTYATIAIWRSFVLLGLLPFIPALGFVADGWSQAIRTGISVGALTILAALTRNEVLRGTELQADAASVAAGPRAALRALLGRLSSAGPRRLALLRAYPDPRRRVASLENPATVLQSGTWALIGVGMTAAIMGDNIENFLHGSALALSLLGTALAGLLCVPGLVAAMTIAAWRAVSRDPAGPRLRSYLRPAIAIAAGFLLGEQLALAGVNWYGSQGPAVGGFVVAALLLVAGNVLFIGWATSAARLVLSIPPQRQRRALVGIVVAGTVAAAPWFAVWFAFRRIFWRTEVMSTAAIAPGVDNPWYGPISVAVSLQYAPLTYVFANPLTLPGMLLLCLAPLAVARWRRDAERPRTDLAIVAGLVGGIVVIAAGVALTMVARDQLPSTVRHSDGFPLVYFNTYVALAALTQGLVAFFVATKATRSRPALALFGALLTGVLAAGGTRFIFATARCAALFGRATSSCMRPFESQFTSELVHSILIKGAVAAIPATMLGIAIGTTWRRLRSAGRPESQRFARREMVTRILTVITVILLIIAAIERIPDAYGLWVE